MIISQIQAINNKYTVFVLYFIDLSLENIHLN